MLLLWQKALCENCRWRRRHWLAHGENAAGSATSGHYTGWVGEWSSPDAEFVHGDLAEPALLDKLSAKPVLTA